MSIYKDMFVPSWISLAIGQIWFSQGNDIVGLIWTLVAAFFFFLTLWIGKAEVESLERNREELLKEMDEYQE